MVLAIDFDDVIHDTKNKPVGKKMGKPCRGALDAMRALERDGNELIIHTVRAYSKETTRAVVDWLDYFDFPYHGVTNMKPNADFYIDNKALRHLDWVDTLAALYGERNEHNRIG